MALIVASLTGCAAPPVNTVKVEKELADFVVNVPKSVGGLQKKSADVETGNAPQGGKYTTLKAVYGTDPAEQYTIDVTSIENPDSWLKSVLSHVGEMQPVDGVLCGKAKNSGAGFCAIRTRDGVADINGGESQTELARLLLNFANGNDT